MGRAVGRGAGREPRARAWRRSASWACGWPGSARPAAGSARAGSTSSATAGCATAPRRAGAPGTTAGWPCCRSSWRHVDASCVLPQLRLGASGDGSGDGAARAPARFLAGLEVELDRLGRDGGYLAIVLHPFMLDWLGEERLEHSSTGSPRASPQGELWVAPCAEVADHDPGGPRGLPGRHDAGSDQLGGRRRLRQPPASAGADRADRLAQGVAGVVVRHPVQLGGGRGTVSISTGRRMASIQAASSGR